MKKKLVSLSLCALLLAGCIAAPGAPAPTPTPTATPAATASPAPTASPDNTPERFWELAAHDQYLAGVITDCRFTDYPGASWIAFTADDGQTYRVEGALGKEHEGLLPFHSVSSYSGKESDECRPGWQVLVCYEDTLTAGQTTITRPKDIFLFFPEDTAGPEEQLFTTEYELGVLRKNFDGIQGKTVFTPDEAMQRVAAYLGLRAEAQSSSPGVTQYTDGSHTLDFRCLWYNPYYQLDREQAARANADLTGWAAKLDDPDFPGEQALTTPYVEYEVLDRQSDGQSTPYYVSITGEVSTTPTTVTPTLAILSEEEEKAQFLNFWEDAQFFYLVSSPPKEPAEDPRYDYYRVVSNYLEHHTQRMGETILRDTDDAPCFPYEDFLGAARAIFGPDTDYATYIPNDPGPEGTARAAWGYGLTYVQAALEENSFVLDGDTITIQALQQWVEPGYSEDLGTLTYTFAVQPENEYCRYRLLSVEEVC